MFYDELATTNELKIVNSNLDRVGGRGAIPPSFSPSPSQLLPVGFPLITQKR